MTTVVYAVTTNPPAPDLMVKRLFTVAAILSRQSTSVDSSEFLVKSGLKNTGKQKSGCQDQRSVKQWMIEVNRDGIRQKEKGYTGPTPTRLAVYLRTRSDENQKPEMSRARQKFTIDANVLAHSSMPVFDEYIDVLTGKTPNREGYQRLLADARTGKFSHVIVERADRFGAMIQKHYGR